LDPITDIFRTMHVTAFGQHRLEATAPWGVIQEKQTEEKVTPSDKKMSPTDLAHFAMLSRGNCWLSVEEIPEPIPLTGGDWFLLARGTSIVLRDSPRTRPRWSFREIGAKANSNVAHYGGGGAPTTIVCGSFSFDRASLKPITRSGTSPTLRSVRRSSELSGLALTRSRPIGTHITSRRARFAVVQGSYLTGW
jgi:hypothetical protein